MKPDLQNTFLTALERNQQKLLRVCSVYAEDEEDLKDLLQEAILNIWQSMSRFEGRSSISTWMFRITLNVCLRLQNKQAKKKDHIFNMDSLAIASIKDDPLDQENHEQLIKLRKCIEQLNDADKAVISLYLEELPYAEISSITGLTENNIAVKVKRIKQKLLNYMK